jgi:hypothetical protein
MNMLLIGDANENAAVKKVLNTVLAGKESIG